MTETPFSHLGMVVAVLVVLVSMSITWLAIPYTPHSPVLSFTSKISFKYFGASLVGFFEILAYGVVKRSLKLVTLATACGIVGLVIFLSFP
jgi:hypothetical protein